MKKKNLLNIKGAGRTAIHDRGIRHIARDQIKRGYIQDELFAKEPESSRDRAGGRATLTTRQ
jgi:hypothetical protein